MGAVIQPWLYDRGRPAVSTPVRCGGRGSPGTVVPMIEVNELTKLYGRRTAVDRLTFTVRPGHVTGFLGPNGWLVYC